MSVTRDEITHRYGHHPITTASGASRRDRIHAHAGAFAEYLTHNTPACREQSLALTAIEEAVFWADAAVARNQTKETAPDG